jgi:hypothetical protein
LSCLEVDRPLLQSKVVGIFLNQMSNLFAKIV